MKMEVDGVHHLNNPLERSGSSAGGGMASEVVIDTRQAVCTSDPAHVTAASSAPVVEVKADAGYSGISTPLADSARCNATMMPLTALSSTAAGSDQIQHQQWTAATLTAGPAAYQAATHQANAAEVRNQQQAAAAEAANWQTDDHHVAVCAAMNTRFAAGVSQPTQLQATHITHQLPAGVSLLSVHQQQPPMVCHPLHVGHSADHEGSHAVPAWRHTEDHKQLQPEVSFDPMSGVPTPVMSQGHDQQTSNISSTVPSVMPHADHHQINRQQQQEQYVQDAQQPMLRIHSAPPAYPPAGGCFTPTTPTQLSAIHSMSSPRAVLMHASTGLPSPPTTVSQHWGTVVTSPVVSSSPHRQHSAPVEAPTARHAGSCPVTTQLLQRGHSLGAVTTHGPQHVGWQGVSAASGEALSASGGGGDCGGYSKQGRLPSSSVVLQAGSGAYTGADGTGGAQV